MSRSRLGAAAVLVLAFLVPALLLVPLPPALSQMPQAEPSWTPEWSAECAQLWARLQAHQKLTELEYSAFEVCKIDAFGRHDSKPWQPRPEWHPGKPVPYTRYVLPMPTPSP